MGFILSMQKYDNVGNPTTDEPEARREGTKFLGEKLKDALVGKKRRRQFATAVRSAINETINAKVPMGQPNENKKRFEVSYEYTNAGGIPKSRRIVATTVEQHIVVCELDGIGAKLVLNIEADRRDAEAFDMDIVFPSENDANDFAYLAEAAKDLGDLQGDPSGGQNYITAFKFLTRCK